MGHNALRLHEKYGLNPTISCCVFCGKNKKEVVLLGASYPEKAPASMVIDYEPCKECEEHFKKGGVFLCIDNNFAAFTVVTEEAFIEAINLLLTLPQVQGVKIDKNEILALEKAKQEKRLFLDKKTYEALFPEEKN